MRYIDVDDSATEKKKEIAGNSEACADPVTYKNAGVR